MELTTTCLPYVYYKIYTFTFTKEIGFLFHNHIRRKKFFAYLSLKRCEQGRMNYWISIGNILLKYWILPIK